MEGAYITALRTVAASAVSTKHLCNADASVMALVGCGVQGKYHALALPHMIPSISTLRVSDSYEPSLRSFVETMAEHAPGLKVEVCDTPESAIRGADLVVTATGKLLEPIFEQEWVAEGALLLPVHTLGWSSSTASAMDKLIVDDWNQYRTVGDIHYQPLPEKPHAETGEVVAGLRPGREDKRERIVNFNKGIAIHDILMARVIFERSRERGLGQDLELVELDRPLPMLEL